MTSPAWPRKTKRCLAHLTPIAPIALLVVLAAVLGPTGAARSEVKLATADGWEVSTDGRANVFVSHVFGDNRPAGLESLNWVGFNEATSKGHFDAGNRLRRTRIRSGYVPTTLAFNLRNEVSPSLRLWSRVEVGIQIANQKPTEIGDTTWMEPRAAFLDLSGPWGSVRGGRDLGLFGRGGLFLDHELGHGYGLGFPCSYEVTFGGSCGHVGFGIIWPDFKAQLTYTTPKLADRLQLSVGAFDPRSFPPSEWYWTPLPRFESEAVLTLGDAGRSGVKLWANAFYQRLGTTQSIDALDAAGKPTGRKELQDFTQDVGAIGGGAKADLGPLQIGASGHRGKGLDGFMLLSFNPVALSLGPVPNQDKRFRTVTAFLVQAALHLGMNWLSAGFGRTLLDLVEGDYPADAVGPPPQLRAQTGVSLGAYRRVAERLVLGVDYFRAAYAFDARLVANPAGGAPLIEEPSQVVHALNAGVTLEW